MPYKDPEKQRLAKHLWYVRNKEAHKINIKRRRSERRDMVIQHKMDNPTCTDCGIDYPYYVLDFDHLPQFEKAFPLSAAGHKDKSLDQIRAEIAKCEIVCSNCHRHRTAVRKGQIRQTSIEYQV
jgi:hypothetical protein